MTEPTPAGWRSEWYDRIAAAAEAAAKSGLTPQEAMAGADFVFSAYWQSERGEDFPYRLAPVSPEEATDA